MVGGIVGDGGEIGEDMRGCVFPAGAGEGKREGLALLTARTMLDVRGANLTGLAAARCRGQPSELDMRYQWVGRLLGNEPGSTRTR